ncbi:hypothetical protein DAI22_09g042600 [Oryza sativa Japonica Group]|nr:hypothetical protein DAI22_09g042600 [Oryza sativa Japonica Group]
MNSVFFLAMLHRHHANLSLLVRQISLSFLNACSTDCKHYSAEGQAEICIETLLTNLTACWERSRTGSNRPECKIPLLCPPQRPAAVCIGPNHHNPFYHLMEQEKKVMLYGILILVDEQHKAAVLRRLVDAVTALESVAKEHYYMEQVPCDAMRRTAGFVQMLLLDGCYILGKFVLHDLLLVRANGAGTSQQQQHGTGSAMQNMELVRDVFYRLDNQIPFCVLRAIYGVLRECRTTPGVMARELDETLAVQVQALLKHFGYSIRNQVPREIWHLHHMLHKHFVPQDDPIPTGDAVRLPVDVVDTGRRSATAAAPTLYRWRAATFYHATGVIFMKRHLRHGASSGAWRWFVDGGGARSVLDVKFHPLTLRLSIPPLMVDMNTSTVLRNLMMLEQHNPSLGSQVTAYCYFLSQLAGTASDVALLAKKGIIVSLLASDGDVARMLGELCVGITINPADERSHNYLLDTRKGLERMYKTRVIRWIAQLYHRYLSNPFVLTVLVAAMVGFVCELIQAIYAVKSFKRRP